MSAGPGRGRPVRLRQAVRPPHQVLRRHRLDDGFAYRVRDLKQDFAVALGLDQFPDLVAFLQRQRFKDVGDVSRVQLIQLRLQAGNVLFVDQLFHQVMPGHFLTVNQILHQVLTRQQLLHLLEVSLQLVLILVTRLFAGFGGVGHGGPILRGYLSCRAVPRDRRPPVGDSEPHLQAWGAITVCPNSACDQG